MTKAAYVMLGIHMDGRKDILGVWIGENESSKFWLNVLNDLKNRGVQDACVFCVDGLNGFREAIGAAYPKSQMQRCIIHQIRSSTRYVSYKDIKLLMADLKPGYQAINEENGKQGQSGSCFARWEITLIQNPLGCPENISFTAAKEAKSRDAFGCWKLTCMVVSGRGERLE